MRRSLCIAMAAAVSLTACGRIPGETASRGPSFPPPPATPRIQFLASYSSSRDVTRNRAGFAKLVFGTSTETDDINKPYGLAVWRGVIYACDTKRNLVNIFDVPGERFGYLGTVGPGKLQKPINITIDADGTRFVADAGRGDIVMFNKNDDYLGSFGAGELERPVDIAVNDSLAFVCDAATNEIVVFRKGYRRYAWRFGGRGTKPGKFARPTNVALDDEGNVYVSDTINGRVQKLDRTGKHLKTFGRLGDAHGEFARPKGIALDRKRRLYAVDAAFENVQIFDDAGRLLMFFGGGGNEPGRLNLPAKVVVDYTSVPYFKKLAHDFDVEYIVLVSSQYGPRKINVYAFGKPSGTSPDNGSVPDNGSAPDNAGGAK